MAISLILVLKGLNAAFVEVQRAAIPQVKETLKVPIDSVKYCNHMKMLTIIAHFN